MGITAIALVAATTFANDALAVYCPARAHGRAIRRHVLHRQYFSEHGTVPRVESLKARPIRRDAATTRGGGVEMARRAAVIDRTGIVSKAMTYLGRGNPTGVHVPWCALFLGMVLRQSGHQAPATAYAPDYAGYGHRSGPGVGSIAVFRGHVGIVVGRIGASLEILSGNYGHRVGVGPWPLSGAIAFRTPA